MSPCPFCPRKRIKIGSKQNRKLLKTLGTRDNINQQYEERRTYQTATRT